MKDLTPLAPVLHLSLEQFEQQLYNLMYHLKQPLSEILSWPTSLRNRMWGLHEKQREFERAAMDKKG